MSLQLGHRVSADIDLFTDALYETIDFGPIYTKLLTTYPYIIGKKPDNKGFGESYIIGESAQDGIKVDLYYTDPFMFPPIIMNNIQMADLRDIVVMKLEVISNGGRKKDFWDLSELLEIIPFESMLKLYQQKYPYFETSTIIKQMSNFQLADEMEDPVCLRGKYWKLIKLDLEEMISKFNKNTDI